MRSPLRPHACGGGGGNNRKIIKIYLVRHMKLSRGELINKQRQIKKEIDG